MKSVSKTLVNPLFDVFTSSTHHLSDGSRLPSLFTSMLAIGLLFTGGCTLKGKPAEVEAVAEGAAIEQLNYGTELCDFTGDLIETVRYGGKVEMEDGAVYNFMSVECLAGYYLSLPDPSRVRALKVVDFTHGKRLIGVDEAVFLNSPLRPSPNGLFLTAIEAADQKMVTYIYDAYPGPLLEWSDVLNLVGKSWNLAESGKPEGDSDV